MTLHGLASPGTDDQSTLTRLDFPLVADSLQSCIAGDSDSSSLLEAQPRRFEGQPVRLGKPVLGVRAAAGAEHLITVSVCTEHGTQLGRSRLRRLYAEAARPRAESQRKRWTKASGNRSIEVLQQLLRRGLPHPELVEEHGKLLVALIVADARGSQIDPSAIDERDPRRR